MSQLAGGAGTDDILMRQQRYYDTVHTIKETVSSSSAHASSASCANTAFWQSALLKGCSVLRSEQIQQIAVDRLQTTLHVQRQ